LNKAFVKETDDDTDDVKEIESSSLLPKGTKNYITPKGAGNLKNELQHLLNEERPKIVEKVSWAAENGDRSENADYIYGKRRLREIDRRIRFLTKRLESTEIIDPKLQESDRVLFGATVTVLDGEDNIKIYKIVGIDETDAKTGKVSWISPIGKALLQTSVGDVVTVKIPKGDIELEVKKIEYKEI